MRTRWIAAATLSLALVVLIFGTVIVWFLTPAAPSSITLRRAQAQWAARSINAYVMKTSSSAGSAECGVVEYTVIDGTVAQIHEAAYEGCQTYTVDDLFQRIETFESRCGRNGCACDGATVMEARYDPQTGYPTDIVYRLDFSLRTRYPGYWLRQTPFAAYRGCPWSGNVGYTIHVVSLTPLE
jgi:hypothetical protein